MVTERKIEVPPDWLGTIPEYYVYRVLIRKKIDFDYQSSQLGGRAERGGAVIDFMIISLGIAISVSSSYWHYGRPEVRVSDRAQREALEAQGITVIFIDEEDILRNAWFYVSEALERRDHSKTGQVL